MRKVLTDSAPRLEHGFHRRRDSRGRRIVSKFAVNATGELEDTFQQRTARREAIEA